MNLKEFQKEIKMTTKPKKPVMPDFKNIQVSTKTVIAKTNARYDIQKLFESLPVTEYTVVKKKRGRKKNIYVPDPNENVPSGSIITLKYFEHLRGVDLKPKKKQGKYFRNALSIVMRVKKKLVNFKLSTNGKFQMTGVKTNEHAILCVNHLWDSILNLSDHTLYSVEGNTLKVMFKVVMTNVDFSLGFLVNRSNLDRFFNSNTNFNSLLETSFGYTGVNIKFPMETIPYKKIHQESLDINTGEWSSQKITYDDYLNTLQPAERKKELEKKRYNTFLVFHSGNVIMSGAVKEFMEGPYYRFLDIIKECRPEIEEKLDN